MSTPTPPSTEDHSPNSHAERRRVVAGTVIGTTIEWYDFFLYATAAGLVFRQLFFHPLGDAGATLASFATIGLSFLVRPLGAFLAGHFGDIFGRRVVLMVTLVGMGAATTLIGFLPTYDTIGVWAPILLVFLRLVQGLSAGGEWGGAALMSVEHAPLSKRGIFGASPQIGVPLGLLAASGMLALMSVLFPGDSFFTWGWRIPFWFSALLIFVGIWIRTGVSESPVFKEIAERKESVEAPIKVLFKKHLLLVIFAAFLFAGNNAVGYMTVGGYIQSYATDPDGPLNFTRPAVLTAVCGAAVIWLFTTLLGGWLSDRLGRRNSYFVGWAMQALGVLAFFPLINAGNIWTYFAGLGFLSIGLGLTYGQQSATYTEIFPASVRFSGVSISYAIGAILGGAFAPTIAQALHEATGGTGAITVYLLGMTAVGLIGSIVLTDKTRIPLSPKSEALQQERPFVFSKS